MINGKTDILFGDTSSTLCCIGMFSVDNDNFTFNEKNSTKNDNRITISTEKRTKIEKGGN